MVYGDTKETWFYLGIKVGWGGRKKERKITSLFKQMLLEPLQFL